MPISVAWSLGGCLLRLLLLLCLRGAALELLRVDGCSLGYLITWRRGDFLQHRQRIGEPRVVDHAQPEEQGVPLEVIRGKRRVAQPASERPHQPRILADLPAL